MLTIFTSAKNFTDKNKTRQRNALESWVASCENIEILLLGHCEGVEAIQDIPNIKYTPSVLSNEKGVPYINGLFDIANKIARYDICCFVNADIILTKAFFETVRNIHNQLKSNYLIAGQRLDIDVEETIEYSENWETAFESKYLPHAKVHPPAGSDYFVFPKGQYSKDIIEPTMLVGRPGWDCWLLHDARKRDLKLIDISPSLLVAHQNHDYAHKTSNETERRAEDLHFKQFLSKNCFQPVTLRASNYVFSNNRLIKKKASIFSILFSLSLIAERYAVVNKIFTFFIKAILKLSQKV